MSEKTEAGGLPLRCLPCHVDGMFYGIPTGIVRQSMPAAVGISGVVPFQGDRFEIFDIRHLFGLPPANARQEGVAVLLEDGARRLALLAAGVAAEEEIPALAQLPLPWTYKGFEQRLFSFLWLRQGSGHAVKFRREGLFSVLPSSVPRQRTKMQEKWSNAL
jgi:hypothetical protein